jgi:hypothetical protein
MSFFSGLRNSLNRRNRFNNTQNMRGGAPYRTVSPFMGAGIMGGLLPRKRMAPPSIAEAQGRNMANVGLLPDYMQPGGTGLPSADGTGPAPDQSGGMRSDIMPRNPGYGFNMPKPRSPFQMAPLSMKGGGEADKYPNEGLKALAKEAPEVVKRMGYEMGGLASYSNGGIVDTVIKIISDPSKRTLSDTELKIVQQMILDGKSPEEMARMVKDYRSAISSQRPIKFSDRIRVGPETGYTSSNKLNRMNPPISPNKLAVPKNTFKSFIKDLLKLGTKAPKFSLPSALLGLGSYAALDYLFDDEDVPAPVMSPGRTISDRDRMLMERMMGRPLSDQEIELLIEKLQADE